MTLESVFNLDDQVRSRGLNLATNKDDHILVVVAKGRTLNMGKVCFEIEKENSFHLCQEFNDIFSLTYDYLKGFYPILF